MHVARALLLEPESDSSSSIAAALRELNIDVTCVTTVDGAEQNLGSGAEFDLWVLNIADDEDPAWSLIDDARSQLPEGSCLMVLGHDSATAFERAVGAGAHSYLPRPVKRMELRHGVRQCVDRIHLHRENQALKLQTKLFQTIKNIALAMDVEKLFDLIMDAAVTLTSATVGAVILQDEETEQLQIRASRGLNGGTESHPFNLSPDYLAGLLKEGQPVLLSPQSPEVHSLKAGDEAVESALIAPFNAGGEILGLCIVARVAPPPFDKTGLRVLAQLAEETAPAVHNALVVDRTRELVIKDDLTQAYNRRYFETYLEEELQRAKRYGQSLSLIFLDLDSLKAINNAHGHFIGSRMLQEVAHRIILTVRGIDKVVRYGGDEFCVILPETDLEGANRVAERIRQNVAHFPFLTQEGLNLPMTVSVGVASCPRHARTKENLVKMADKAMFRSKELSKNVVTLASDEADS